MFFNTYPPLIIRSRLTDYETEILKSDLNITLWVQKVAILTSTHTLRSAQTVMTPVNETEL